MNFDFEQYATRLSHAGSASEKMRLQKEMLDFFADLSSEQQEEFQREMETHVRQTLQGVRQRLAEMDSE